MRSLSTCRRKAWLMARCLCFCFICHPVPSTAQSPRSLGFIDPYLDPISFTDDQGNALTLYAVAGLVNENHAYSRTLGLEGPTGRGLRSFDARKKYYAHVLQEAVVQEEFIAPDFLGTLASFSEESPWKDFLLQKVLPKIPGILVKSFKMLDDPVTEKLMGKYLIKLNYLKNTGPTSQFINSLNRKGRWVRRGIQNGSFEKALGALSLVSGSLALYQEGQTIYTSYVLLKALQMDLALERLRFIQEHSTLTDAAFRDALSETISDFENFPADTWERLLQAIALHPEIGGEMVGSVADIGEGLLALSGWAHAHPALSGWLGAVLFTIKTGILIDEHLDALRTSALAATLYRSLYDGRGSPADIDVVEYSQLLFLRDLQTALVNGYMLFLELFSPGRGDTRRLLRTQVTQLLAIIFERRFPDVPESPSSSSGTLALALLLDSSGSMRENDPQRLRVEAAKLAADKLPDNAALALLDFDEQTTLLHPMTVVAGTHAAFKQASNRIDAAGGTDIGKAVAAAARLLTAAPDPSTRAAILLTDGNGGYENQERLFTENGWRLYTIGLGTGINIELLASLARNTGGQYFKATTAADLGPILDSILADLTGNALLVSFTAFLAPGEHQTFPFYLDDTAATLNGLLTWTEGSLRLRLLDPSGREAPLQPSRGETYEVFQFSNPSPGPWQAVIEAVSSTTERVPFHLQLSSESPLRPELVTFPTAIQPGSSAWIQVALPSMELDANSLSTRGLLVREDKVTAAFPLELQTNTDTDTFLFTGQTPVSSVLGDQRVRLILEGRTQAGIPFQRYLERTFTVTTTADTFDPFLITHIIGSYLEITGAQKAGLRPGLSIQLIAPDGMVIGSGYITSVLEDQATIELQRLFVDSLTEVSFRVALDATNWQEQNR